MPPLEAWEKVYFDNEVYFEDLHANLGCTTCHGGTSGTDDIEAAHEGMVPDPDQVETCGTCHAETVNNFTENSLHWDLGGYMTVLQERSDEEHMPQLLEAYDNHCASCHSSCGQCHISRPAANGGGLLDGHVFKGTPPPYSTCTGCHGSRVESEFKGKNTDKEENRYPADVHYNPGGMNCNDCHAADEMHGTAGDVEHRYEGAVVPSCTDEGCHEGVASSDIPQHSEGHLAQLSCQVCHTISYKNCYNCHVQQSDEGVPFFKIDESQMGVQIGLNPIRTGDRPWKYVPVRHVPIARDSFAYYGEDLLPNFDSRPTWTYATPHTIQRVTPQNQGCDCHSNLDLFLTADDVEPDELEANQAIIVAQVPQMELSDEPPIAEPAEEPTEESATEPTAEPTEEPTVEPTAEPTAEPPDETTPTPEPVEAPDAEAPPPAESYTGAETCSACHSNPDLVYEFPSGEVWSLYMDADAFHNSVHGQEGLTCAACHTDIEDYPHSPLEVTSIRAYQLAQYQTCKRCHDEVYEEALDSMHASELAGGNWNAAICTDCHYAHDIQSPDEPRTRIPETCSTCHAAIYNEYLDSVHGHALIDEQNTDVPTCIGCHGVHTQEDPRTTEFRLNSPDLCATCHADEAMMGKYGISTAVFDTYVADFHGTTVTLFERQSPDLPTNKPVCYDCHGVHNMKSPTDPDSQVFQTNLLSTCQRCHPDATENFPTSWLSHYEPNMEKYPIIYLVDLFYKILVPAVIGFMVLYVSLDAGSHLVRRFRGKQSEEAK